MDKIAVLDFGGQYAHLIANRVRRKNVYSEILSPSTEAKELKKYKGIILSGGPQTVYDPTAPQCDDKIFELGIPMLGVCYGHQLMMLKMGGEVAPGTVKEYGLARMYVKESIGIFAGLPNEETNVWMSHGDEVKTLPEGFEMIGETRDCHHTAVANMEKKMFGIQFHFEVTHTPKGMEVLDNFLDICEVERSWKIDNFIEEEKERIRKQVGKKKVFLLISGGVDSTVTFLLLKEAIGADNIYGLFVDTGLMRYKEKEEVKKNLKEDLGFEHLVVYDGEDDYLEALQEVYDPEEKRKIIGDLFLDIKDKVTDKLELNPSEWLLAQGTIYPDTIESGGTEHADKIKTHHNRVDRVQELIAEGKVIEPIAQLYKDEVREVGKKLGLKKSLIWRHPFPGPGLGVRILCANEVAYPPNVDHVERKVNTVLGRSQLHGRILPIQSVGVQGDFRSYRHPLLLFGEASWEQLEEYSTRFTNEFSELNRVVYSVSHPKIEMVNLKPGYITKDRVTLLQKADHKVNTILRKHNLYDSVWQFPIVLVPLYVNANPGEVIILRPICSDEAMTANFAKLPTNVIREMADELMKIKGICAVFYDITNKPPGTIEWE